MKRFLLTMTALVLATASTTAQRRTDQLDRGLIAMKTARGMYLNWRIQADEYYDVSYIVYRDGHPINDKPLSVSNYTDAEGTINSKYTVAAVVNGVVKDVSKVAKNWNTSYTEIQLNHEGIKSTLVPNDATCADVDGDGELEIIMKFDNLSEKEQSYPKYGPKIDGVDTKEYTIFECFKLDGTRLWWINCGPNMADFQNNEQNIMAYDWDGDGKAECVMRATDGLTMHMGNGETYTVGDPNSNVRGANGGGVNWFICTDGEYLLYFNGETGAKYQEMPYPLKLRETPGADLATEWGHSGWQHRSSKHFFGAPYFDGKKPSIFLARGIYTRHKMIAYDVNPTTHQLTQRWRWDCNAGGPWKGQGYHNYCVADVDWDGRDEIVFGSMVIDDNGKGLSTTGYGHGDAEQVGDLDPYLHGHEVFACMEDNPGTNYRDATTSKVYYRYIAGSDVGRCMAGNFSNAFPGSMGTPTDIGPISLVTCKTIPGITEAGVNQNMRIYWDGDLLEETFNYVNGKNTAGCIAKYGSWSPIYTMEGSMTNNDTKGTPCFQGDILGDWREEVIMRTANNNIRIYSTPNATKWRIPSLWYDHQYRNAMVWQMCGYNQPPRPSYFLGELEGITMAPPTLTTTGRIEVLDNGTINSSLNGQHVMVSETSNSNIAIEAGAQPAILTFNVPTWVQGTAPSECTTKNTKINYETYTCTVTGGGISGKGRLVKQGDGILELPKVDMTHTGETNIWAGVLNFDGTMKNSPLWLNRFAELNSDGGQFRSIKMDYASILRPGRADNCGTITTDSLLLGFGSRVIIDLYEDFSADQINTKFLNIETKNWQHGPEYLNPVIEVVYHGEGDIEPGKYLIGKATEIKGSINDIQIEGVSSNKKATLITEEGNLYIIIEGMRSATTINWTGSESTVWDLDNTANFTKEDEKSTFVTGDDVFFGDDATQFNVTINSELETDTIFVENTKAYTIQGAGSLTGNSTLNKNGKGLLTIKTENSYTGGNRISGGAVIVTSLANSTQAKGNLGAVTTSASKFIIENGGELRTTATVTNGSAIKFESEAGGIINNSADFTVDRAMTGTKLTKKGSGWLKLNVSNTSLNTLVITAGTVQCLNSNTPAKTVEFQGGTLRENTSTSYTINVPQGKQGYWYMANRSNYSNKITGAGTLTAYCVTEKGTNYYATRTQVQCDFSNFEGTLIPTSSLDDPSVLRFTLNTSSGMPKGTMNIASNVEVQNSGKTFRIGKLTGSGALGGGCTFSNGTSVGANTWQVGNDANWGCSVKVTSNSNLVKLGTGKITWSGANTNTGTTTIKEGELCIATSGKLGTGKLTIAQGATFSGANSTSKQLENASVEVNGILRPGSYNGAFSGTLFFSGKNVTLNQSAVLIVGTNKCATASVNGCTNLQNIGTLTINGTIRIVPIPGNTLAVGDSIRLWSNVTKFVGTPTIEGTNGIEWDDSRISEGLLFVKSIATGITPQIADTKATSNNIYDLRGRLIRKSTTSAEGLKPGIYVIEGRKVIVK